MRVDDATVCVADTAHACVSGMVAATPRCRTGPGGDCAFAASGGNALGSVAAGEGGNDPGTGAAAARGTDAGGTAGRMEAGTGAAAGSLWGANGTRKGTGVSEAHETPGPTDRAGPELAGSGTGEVVREPGGAGSAVTGGDGANCVCRGWVGREGGGCGACVGMAEAGGAGAGAGGREGNGAAGMAAEGEGASRTAATEGAAED